MRPIARKLSANSSYGPATMTRDSVTIALDMFDKVQAADVGAFRRVCVEYCSTIREATLPLLQDNQGRSLLHFAAAANQPAQCRAIIELCSQPSRSAQNAKKFKSGKPRVQAKNGRTKPSKKLKHRLFRTPMAMFRFGIVERRVLCFNLLCMFSNQELYSIGF